MDVKDILGKIHIDIQNQRKKLLYMKQKIEEQQEILKIWELEQITDIAGLNTTYIGLKGFWS